MKNLLNHINDQYVKDVFYMRKAINLASKGKYTTHPNPNVGCIIVKNDVIVGFGWHIKSGGSHAEVNAINMAGSLSKNGTAYISLEPCNFFGKTPPCCDAIIKSGIKRVVISILDPNPKVAGQGIKALQQAGIQITTGILSEESKQINQGFFKKMQTGIPWVRCKMAISIDGKTSMHNGDSQWITNIECIKDVHKFRALSAAILSTSNTVLRDNPKLTTRYIKENITSQYQPLYLQPIRIIIDSKNRINPDHNVIQITNSPVWLIRLFKDDIIWPNHVKQIVLPKCKDQINLKELLKFLGKKKINSIWTECGSILFSSMIDIKIIDELIIYIAPKMLGNTAKSLYLNNVNLNLNQIATWNIINTKKIGNNIRIILQP